MWLLPLVTICLTFLASACLSMMELISQVSTSLRHSAMSTRGIMKSSELLCWFGISPIHRVLHLSLAHHQTSQKGSSFHFTSLQPRVICLGIDKNKTLWKWTIKWCALMLRLSSQNLEVCYAIPIAFMLHDINGKSEMLVNAWQWERYVLWYIKFHSERA
jgi:hypothetical protein